MVGYGRDVPQGIAVAAVVGGGVAKCVTGTPRDGRDVAARVDPLAWDGVRQRRRPAPSETCVGVLITRRSQVQILPPLPTASTAEGPDNWSGPSAVQAADLQVFGVCLLGSLQDSCSVEGLSGDWCSPISRAEAPPVTLEFKGSAQHPEFRSVTCPH